MLEQAARAFPFNSSNDPRRVKFAEPSNSATDMDPALGTSTNNALRRAMVTMPVGNVNIPLPLSVSPVLNPEDASADSVSAFTGNSAATAVSANPVDGNDNARLNNEVVVNWNG